MRLSEEEIAGIVMFEIQQARGYDSDVLSAKRERALDYYYGFMAPPTTGRSSIVSTDVADAVHSTLAQIQPIVKTTMVEFEPNSEEDEAMAQAESDFVRKIIERSGGYNSIFDVCHDALLIGNGWLKVSVIDEEKYSENKYPRALEEVEVAVVSQPQHEDEEVEVSISEDETIVVREWYEKKILFETIPPEDMIFADRPGTSSLHALRFVGQRKLMTAAELEEYGVPREKIDLIPDSPTNYFAAEVAREGIYQQEMDNLSAQTAERLKEIYCCYIRIAMGSSYDSELRYIWVGGDQVLKNEPAGHCPYITGSAVPTPHRVSGTGMFELLGSVQDGKTHILRNWMDNLEVMNSSRVAAVEGQVNMKDLTNGRINGVVRVKSPTAVVPLPSTDIGMQAMQGLNYLDTVRVQRVGSSIDLNELQGQIMQSSATAAAGQIANVEKMAGWYATNLVETLIKPAFILVHKLMRTEMGGQLMAKIRGKWQQTDSSQWPERENLQITMGMTTAERTGRMQALQGVINMQQQILQGGGAGVLTDNAKIYNSMSDWMRASDLQQPQEYLIDPTSQEAQQAQQNQAQAGQQQAQQQAQQMLEMQKALIDAQGQIELLKQERDIKYKVWADKLDAEVEEAKMTSSGVIQMADLKIKANDQQSGRA